MKKGISLIVLVVTIIITAILAGVVLVTGGNSLDLVDVNKFAVEVLNIQNAVDEYAIKNGTYPVAEEVFFDLSKINTDSLVQFQNEPAAGNIITLKKINLELLGINNITFGNNKTENDIYVVSENTGKVYYLQGVNLEDKVYYTTDSKLYDSTNVIPSSNITSKEVKQYDVIFYVDNINATNNPIQVQIKLPKDAIVNSITSTKSVGEEQIIGAYKVVNVNETSTDETGNYTIVVNYTYNEKTKEAVYSVTNFDNSRPNITSKETIKNEVKTVEITSLSDDVNVLKYELGIITDSEYFNMYGKNILNNKFTLSKDNGYTIYARDRAGNVCIKTIGWVGQIDENKDMLTVTNGTQILNIGDYINYTANDTAYEGKWKIFGADDNGNLLIISADVLEESITLSGKIGYQNIQKKLDENCLVYANNVHAKSARSINMKDIDELTGYDKTQYGVGANKYNTKVDFYWNSDTKPYYIFNNGNGTLNNEHTVFEWYSEDEWQKSNRDTTATSDNMKYITSLNSNYYSYIISDELISSSKAYAMLVKSSDGLENLEYVLATSALNILDNNVQYGIYKINDGSISYESLYSSDMVSNDVIKSLRPIVTLKLDTKFTGNSIEGWEIVE